MDFRSADLADLAQQVRTKQISARELTQHALDRIEVLNPHYNAFVAVDAEGALAEAAELDALIAGGHDPGPLAGIPLAVKDTQDAIGYTTTHGSPLHADDPAATDDLPFVARLRAAGCIVVGKTNTPEFAWCANTTNAVFGPTTNPFSAAHGPGGSSGGAAAALAAGMVPLATGSDGGGSIRIPSSVCGLSGMKPSLGRVPGGGPHAPGWLDLSTGGPMARRIADVTLALDAVVGPDPTDLRALPRPEASWLAALDHPHVPVQITWSPTLGYANVDAEVLARCEAAVGLLEELGAEVTTLDTVFDIDPVSDFLTLMGACQLRTMRPLMGHPRWEETDPVLRMIVEAAESTTAEQLILILDRFHAMNLRLVDLFHRSRILVTPTTSGAAPLLGRLTGVVNGEETASWVQSTYPFNMTRSPAATVCVGLTEAGLPVGLQLIGPQHGDLVVLRTAAALEAALGATGDVLAPLPRSLITMTVTEEAVRLVPAEDAPWADTGMGVLLKVVRYDARRGTWVILNRFHPGVQLQTHRHTGSVDAYTSAGRWHYLEYDFYVTAGGYLYEPANSTHTLHVPDDNSEDTDVCFIIEGALLNLAADGSVESVSDGPSTLAAYYALLEAQGDSRPSGLIV